MRSVADEAANVLPFRRPGRGPGAESGRRDQRGLMDAVYAAGSLAVAAGDRETKLVASRLQVYGFLRVDEVAVDGSLRRLRASEAIRAAGNRPWRLTKALQAGSVSLAGSDPADAFLFEDGLDQAG